MMGTYVKETENSKCNYSGNHLMIGTGMDIKYRDKCPVLLLLAIMLFSQNVGVFSGLAEGRWSVLRNCAQLLILVYLLARIMRKGKVSQDTALYYIVYIGCIIVTMIFHMDKTGIFWVLDLTIAFLFVSIYDIWDVMKHFEIIMFCICSVYLVGYVILRIWLEVSYTPLFQGLVSVGLVHDHSGLVPYYMAGIVAPRAYAFYREPGVYQMFIIVAMVLEFTIFEKVKKSHIIVFALAVLSTYSKTGYISLIVVLLGGAFIIWNKDHIFRQLYLLGVLAVIPLMPKFLNVIVSAFTATGENSHSWMSRLASVIVNLHFYLKNPIVGVSVGGVFRDFAKVTKEIYGITAGSYDVTDDTNTILLNFAAFGTILGLMFVVAQWKCIKSLTPNKMARFLFFMALVFLYAGEAVNSTTFPYIICFIGASSVVRNRLKETWGNCSQKTITTSVEADGRLLAGETSQAVT